MNFLKIFILLLFPLVLFGDNFSPPNNNSNLRDYIDLFLLGKEESFVSLPLYIATALLEIFKDYLALFLVIIIGIMGWQKMQGEQWSRVLVNGGASVVVLLGSVFLTDSKVEYSELKSLNDKGQIHYLIKGEAALIKMGQDIADDLWKTLMFGKPTKDGNGNKTWTLDTSNSFFINRHLNMLKPISEIEDKPYQTQEEKDAIEKEAQKHLDEFNKGLQKANINKRMILLSRMFMQMYDGKASDADYMLGIDMLMPYDKEVSKKGFLCGVFNTCATSNTELTKWEAKEHSVSLPNLEIGINEILTSDTFYQNLKKSSIYKRFLEANGINPTKAFYKFQQDLEAYGDTPLFIKEDGYIYPYFIKQIYFKDGILDTYFQNYIKPHYEKIIDNKEEHIETRVKAALTLYYSELVFTKNQLFLSLVGKKGVEVLPYAEEIANFKNKTMNTIKDLRGGKISETESNSISNLFNNKLSDVMRNRGKVITECRIPDFFGDSVKPKNKSYKFENYISNCLINEYNQDERLLQFFLKDISDDFMSGKTDLYEMNEIYSFIVSPVNLILSQIIFKTKRQEKISGYNEKNLVDLYFLKNGEALENLFDDPANDEAKSYVSLMGKTELKAEDILKGDGATVATFFADSVKKLGTIDGNYANNSNIISPENISVKFNLNDLTFKNVERMKLKDDLYEWASDESQKWKEALEEKIQTASWMELGSVSSDLKQTIAPYILGGAAIIEESSAKFNKMNYIKEQYKYVDKDNLLSTAKTIGQVYGGLTSFMSELKKYETADKGIIGKTLMSNPYGRFLAVGLSAVKIGFSVAVWGYVATLLMDAILSFLPALIWMLGVMMWYIKTAIILSVLPLATFMLSFVNFQQFKSAVLTLIALMLAPIVMVVTFFVSTEISIILPILVDKFLPMIHDITSMLNITNPTFKDLSEKIVNILFIAQAIKIFIIIVLTTMLYTFFLRSSEYIQMIIGSSVSLDGGDREQTKILQRFKMDVV